MKKTNRFSVVFQCRWKANADSARLVSFSNSSWVDGEKLWKRRKKISEENASEFLTQINRLSCDLKRVASLFSAYEMPDQLKEKKQKLPLWLWPELIDRQQQSQNELLTTL